MALTDTRPETETVESPTTERPEPTSLERVVGTGDHTTIGRLFIGFSLVFLTVAAVVRALVGFDIATDNGFLGGRTDMLGVSSLIALILLGAVPLLLGLAICIVPLQVGSAAVAFPRAAALSFWAWLISSGIFVTSVAIDGGFGGTDTDAARLGNVAIGGVMAAIVLGSVCVATTVVAHRPLGMGLGRVPLFSWSMLVGSAIWIATLSSAFAHVIVGQVAHLDAEGLSANFATGLAWLVRGPAIFMIAIPILGIAGDVFPTVTGRRLKNYGVFQGLIGAFAVLSFGAWAQLPRSVNSIVWSAFAAAIALPVIGMLGGLAESLRYGKVKVSGSLVGSVVGLLLILGAALATVLQAFDRIGVGELFSFREGALVEGGAYFAVTAAVVGGLAGLVQWSPQLFGGRSREPAASGTCVLVFLGGGLIGTVLVVQGIVQHDGGTTANQLFGALSAVGVVLVALGLLGALSLVVSTARSKGPNTDDTDSDDSDTDENGVGGLTLEWATSADRTGPGGEALVVASPYPLLDAREGDEEGSS